MSIRLIGKVVVVISFLVVGSAVQGADSPREHLVLDLHWRFHLGDAADVGKRTLIDGLATQQPPASPVADAE